ncbi:MAG: uroporphyrinogen decarboxylase family protein [Eubacteriaceae bacterium]
MIDIKSLQQERINIFHDVYDNKIPKRVPINISLSFEPIAQYGGLDLVHAQWDPTMVAVAADELCQKFYSDVCIHGGAFRNPAFYEPLKSQSFVMGSNGYIQHPEVEGMLAEEYDFLIDKPLDCLYERVIPRQYKSLNLDNPINMSLSLAKSLMGYNGSFMENGTVIRKLVEKYGYYPGENISGGFTEAPFDFIADQLRGFKGISADIRRYPEKVVQACEAVYPIVKKKGMPSQVSNYGHVFFPLHMPTFMREKDFAKYWWPSFKKLIDDYASMGIHSMIFCEDNWSRYLDYLYELPTDTVMMFEYGDPKKIKDKLGKKHIITGLYPLIYMKTHTKQECIDKAKEYIDILAPGGKYIFGTDKGAIALDDLNLENFAAVTETVRDYGVYSNPGETAGMLFNKNNYTAVASRKLESKYYSTWDQYKSTNPNASDFGAPKLQGFEEMLFQYMISLLL